MLEQLNRPCVSVGERHMARQVDLTKTPTKISKFLNISPKSKSSICMICGNSIENASNRRRLFIGNDKTEPCLLVEKVLKVTIYRECCTHTVCRQCVRDVTRVDNTLDRLISSFENTTKQLYNSHGAEVTKRLRSEDQQELKYSRRKSLFPEQERTCGDEDDTVLNCSSDTDEIKVTITTSDGCKQHVVQSLSTIALATTTPDFRNLSAIVLHSEELRSHVLHGICEEIRREVITLCSKSESSVLRTTNASNLQNISWEAIASEWQTKAPTYWALLNVFKSNPSLQRNKIKDEKSLLPALVSAGSKLLSIYNRELNGLQHLISIILLKGGAKKSAFNRLSITKDSTSYLTAVNDLEEISKQWDKSINDWKNRCEEDVILEKDHLQKLLEAETYVTEHGASPYSLLILDQEQRSLDALRKNMHPGYYIVGDNVDFYTKVRTMSESHQNKSQHMFQICAYKNRVAGNDLDDSKPKQDAETLMFSTMLPSEEDQSKVVNEFSFIVAKKWIEFIPCFRVFDPVLPPYISHKYMKEMKEKTERVNIGVLEKNEQYNDQMTDICEFMHKFVPGHSETADINQKTQKILSGGDYLTFERHKQAQMNKSNGRTESKRLQGLIPKIEEFHNQAEFLKLIWSLLYDTSSSNSIGTLYAARNKMNSKNVPSDPHGNYYACSEFMDKVTSAYIVSGGLEHFQMENMHDSPNPSYAGPVGDKEAMKEYLMEHAHQFVRKHCTPSIPTLPTYGIQSNETKCRYCDKVYKRHLSLRKHEALIHDHPDPRYNPKPENCPPTPTFQKATVYDYTRLCLTLGLLRLNHNNAIQLGDGERMMRIAKFFCYFYKGGKCPKYAYALLETTAQNQALLSERQAERLTWNRTVNHQGKVDTNHPNDLDLEHCNKIFKDDVHTYRGQYTNKTILRVSRSALTTDRICRKFDQLASVRQASGKHKKTDVSSDILSLAEQFHSTRELFDVHNSPTHEHFPHLKDPVKSLKMEDVQKWISESLKTFSKKKYYSY